MWGSNILILLGVAGMLFAAIMIGKMFLHILTSSFKELKQWSIIKYQRVQWVVSTWLYLRRQRKYDELSKLRIGGLFLLVGRDKL